ncbi:MAG TPA: DUF5666 domain-containing protein [Candidatus Acidoferrum sp.]|nr:DUF5666 domain-containing protein [Candidatus Acidoferrum sp.]
MRPTIPLALALLSCAFLAACGGSPASMQPTSGVPMSLTIGDTPPNGVGVLFFEASITGASLQPSDSSKAAVSVLTAPAEVEFSHLQTDTAFLSLANVPPDTYSSLTLTFGNAQLTIVNHSTGAIGSCAKDAVCQMTPSFATSTAMLSGAPFPITINMNSVVGIKLDLDVNSSIQNDLTVKPSVTIAHLRQREDADEDQEMEDLDEVQGQVTALGSNQFTLMNRRSGKSFMVNVDSNTVFEDFDRAGCTATPADFSCVKMDQILEVRLSENGTGTMLAKRVEFVANASQLPLKGTITSVDSSTQFHMVVFLEEPGVNGISEGSQVAVTIAPNAAFQVGREEMGDDGGFAMLGFGFATAADLMVGQDVQIRPGTVTTTGGVTTITTDLVRLWPSQITGQVGNIDSGMGTFTLTNLSPLFTGAMPAVNTINVQTLSFMDFEDFPNQASLAVGNTVSVKGLLFNTQPTPTLVTRTVHDHTGD